MPDNQMNPLGVAIPTKGSDSASVLRVVFIYATFAALWILVSDSLVAEFIASPAHLLLANSLKGIGFVITTSVLLYVLMLRLLKQIRHISDQRDTEVIENSRIHNLLSEILDNSSDAIFAKDKQGRYILFNAEAARVVGKSAKDVLGKDDFALFPKEQASLIQKNDLAVINQNMSRTSEEALTTVDGDVIFSATKGPLHDLDGRVRGLFGISRDITERSRMENALRLSEEWLRESQEVAGIGTYMLDFRSGEWVSSSTLDRLLGIDKTYPHTVSGWLELVHPDDREMMNNYFADEIVGKMHNFNKEYRVQMRTTLETRWVNGIGRLELDEQGNPTRMIGAVHDITKQKAHEEILIKASLDAEAASQAKSRFVATVSHEIRTPLNGILGMAQLLHSPCVSDEERLEFSKTILDSGQTLLTLLNDILDLSKIEAGKLSLKQNPVYPSSILEESAGLFAGLAREKGLHLETAWHGPSDDYYLADAVRIRQMLSNLISNAIKFSSSGTVRVETSLIESNKQKAVLEFSVTDCGIGIPAEKQALLFKPFSQVDSSITRSYGGTGLGLSIVKMLAQAMGGEVGVASTVGEGTRVWFRVVASVGLDTEE